jgi:hypothetical protein
MRAEVTGFRGRPGWILVGPLQGAIQIETHFSLGLPEPAAVLPDAPAFAQNPFRARPCRRHRIDQRVLRQAGLAGADLAPSLRWTLSGLAAPGSVDLAKAPTARKPKREGRPCLFVRGDGNGAAMRFGD